MRLCQPQVLPGERRGQGPEGSLQGRPEEINYAFHNYLIFPFKNEVVFRGLIEDHMEDPFHGVV